MATLGIMKERIASELRRDDLSSATEFKTLAATSDIHDAIMTAIGEYENEQLYFMQSRGDVAFDTAAAQYRYGASDDADIARIRKMEFGFADIGGFALRLTPRRPDKIESSNSGLGAISGQPAYYGWYAEHILLEPIPNAVFPVRFGCMLQIAAPATDAETGNRWMVDAETLIRSRAKAELYEHVIKNGALADRMYGAAERALHTLRVRTEDMIAPESALVEVWDPYAA